MDKIEILFRKMCNQYDEDFEVEGIVPSEDEFNQMAEQVRMNCKFTYSDAEFNTIKEQVRELRAAKIGLAICLDKPDKEHDLEWYSKYTEQEGSYQEYNKRFKVYMANEKHWSSDMIGDTDRNTTILMNRVGDPRKDGPWARRGLAIGDVQSGKTVNYTSLCNKAVDTGYKIIIVLAGRTNTLRKQTQKRLEKDFIGRMKDDAVRQKGEIVPMITAGVGLYGNVGSNTVEAFTTNLCDFSKKLADATAISINDQMLPKVFVVKKVKSVLENLADWLRTSNRNMPIDVPMLLIDDEADDASVNTKDASSPTTINACIRSILKLFTRKTYLAITATPFANILINPYVEGTDLIDRDLFPEDFIYCLPTPSDYIGSEKLFRDESYINLVHRIYPKEVKEAFPFKHKKTQTIEVLPDSLKDAVRYYAISNVVRDLKGHVKTHRSMMVNVSRFVDVQNRVKDKLNNFWTNQVILYVKAYSKMGSLALDYEEIREIKRVFEENSIERDFGLSWEQIQELLYDSNANVRIVSVNQKSADSIDYERWEKENDDGLRVVAIGGDCLSRGLTLDGLCVSYFYRNSQAYDTLMQMGRWFGYRLGYERLIRIWMADDSVDWYAHISAATEALKLEVYRMNRCDMTPMDFGYVINGHPDSLIPTARAKMKNARLSVKYAEVDISGHLIECPRLRNSETKLARNQQRVKEFVDRISTYSKLIKTHGDLCFKEVEASDVADLVHDFQSMEWHYYLDSATLSDHIKSEYSNDWMVYIKNGTEEPEWTFEIEGTKHTLRSQKRTSTLDDGIIKVSGSHVRIASVGSTVVGLEPPNTIEQLDDEWKALPEHLNMKKDRSGYKAVPDEFILHKVKTPILFIYLLKLVDAEGASLIDGTNNVCALGLAFPSEEDYEKSKSEKKKKKKVKVYLNVIAQQLLDEEGDDEVDENL